jgi:hypothetical protein
VTRTARMASDNASIRKISKDLRTHDPGDRSSRA